MRITNIEIKGAPGPPATSVRFHLSKTSPNPIFSSLSSPTGTSYSVMERVIFFASVWPNR